MAWSADYQLPALLVDVRDDTKTAQEMHAALSVELGRGHFLYGRKLKVIAIDPHDGLVVEVDQQLVALVYLTWSGQEEKPPFPQTEVLYSPARLEQHMERFDRPDYR